MTSKGQSVFADARAHQSSAPARFIIMASAECTAASGEVLRIVLLGRTGSGKSSTGNTLLGTCVFVSDVSPLSVTQQCVRGCAEVEGRSLQVIDTPGFFHTCLSSEEVCVQVARALLELSAPGPHALLLIIKPGKVTAEERSSLRWIGSVLGSAALKHTLLVLTHADQLRDKHTHTFIHQSQELGQLLQLCEGRIHTVDNTAGEGAAQGRELLQKLEVLVQENQGNWYRCERRTLQENQLTTGRGVEEKDKRKKAEHEFWCELVTAMGKGALESSGILDKGTGKGKKCKAVQRTAALVSNPLSVTSAAKMVGGAMREGSKVVYKHGKTLLQ